MDYLIEQKESFRTSIAASAVVFVEKLLNKHYLNGLTVYDKINFIFTDNYLSISVFRINSSHILSRESKTRTGGFNCDIVHAPVSATDIVLGYRQNVGISSYLVT